MISTLFFDFDGVLAESVSVKTEAFYQMYLPYGEEFAAKVRAHHIANGGVSRFEKFKIYNGQWLGETVDETKMASLVSEFSALVCKGVIEAEEVKGAHDFLSNPANQRFTNYIVTGTPTDEIALILKGRAMNTFFKAAYGSPQKKGYWVGKVLKEDAIRPENCIFIGDALADYQAAQQHNITFVLRETPEGEILFKDFKGYRMKDMTALSDIINQIENAKRKA